ncbi:MAG: FtsL-like putative cell division protein [Ferruginibacter sp.]
MAENKTENKHRSSENRLKRLLSYKWVVKNIPFFLFLSVLAVLYIYNRHFQTGSKKNQHYRKTY